MAIPLLLRDLLTAPGPSGYEEAASAVWRAAAEPFAEVWADTLGTSFARVRGAAGVPKLALVGHIDEIGLVATYIDDEGFVAVRRIGGSAVEPFVGQRVVFTSGIKGILARRKDALNAGERKLAKIDDLHVDLGARDGDEARSLVAPGDAAVLDVDPVELREGRLVSRSLDNRLGCYVALEAARRLAERGSPGDVIALAATQEEIGSHGARTAVFELEPAVALVFDVTGASDEPGADARADGAHALGSGPALMRGPVAHPHVLRLLAECAETEDIACTSEVSGGASMSDADVTHISRAGIATGLVSIPLRYMHTEIELVDLADVEACVRLAVAFARRLGPETTFAR